MPIVAKCCCCELRIGVMVIAILEFIGIGYNFYNTANQLAWTNKQTEGNQNSWLNAYGASYKANLFFLAVSLIMAVILFVAAVLNQAKYKVLCLVWIGWTSLMCFFFLISIIVFAIIVKSFAVIVYVVIIYIICILVQGLFIMFVLSYYQELRDGETSPPAYNAKV